MCLLVHLKENVSKVSGNLSIGYVYDYLCRVTVVIVEWYVYVTLQTVVGRPASLTSTRVGAFRVCTDAIV